MMHCFDIGPIGFLFERYKKQAVRLITLPISFGVFTFKKNDPEHYKSDWFFKESDMVFKP